MPGSRGERGHTGAIGATGKRGPAGPAATRAQILAAVQREFDELNKHIRVQLERTAHMQQQLDAIQKILHQLLAKV
jgi:hypothetical protein